MREIKILSALFFAATFVEAIVYFVIKLGTRQIIPLGGVDYLLMSTIIFWTSYRLWGTWIKERSLTQTRTFSLFFFSFGAFLFILFLPHIALIITRQEQTFSKLMDWAYVVGHIFLYISLAIFIRIPLGWISIKLKNAGSAFFLLLGTITTIVNIMYPNHSAFDASNGLTLLHANPMVANLIIFNVILAWIPTTIYFLYEAIKLRDRYLRRRSLILGLGLLVLIIGGPLHDVAQTSLGYLIADVVSLAGNILLAIGVFYKKEEGESMVAQQPNPTNVRI